MVYCNNASCPFRVNDSISIYDCGCAACPNRCENDYITTTSTTTVEEGYNLLSKESNYEKT